MSASRVVIDADVLGRARTGDETYMRGLLAALATSVDDLDLWAATTRPDLVPSGITGVQLGGHGQFRRLLLDLPLALRRTQAALLHGNYFLPPAWRGPAVVTVHDISFARRTDYMPRTDLMAFRTLVPRAMRRAERVLTVTEWARHDILDRYDLDEERVVVTPNGIDEDLLPDGPVPKRPPYLLFVGGLQRRKDPVTAVRALAQLREPLQLVIAGRDRGEAAAVHATIEELGVGDRVDLLDYVSRDDLLALYRGAEALVFPSRYEGFGLPVLEAMACGTPVVAAATTSIPEVAGDAAVLVPPGDPAALAEGIEQALGNAERLVPAGLRRAALFRWSVTADRTSAVYREILA